MLIRLILLCFIASSSLHATAANYYVRASATGVNDGSDWTDAWESTGDISMGSLNPGDTVYFAGGTYGALGIYAAGSAGNPLTFKRATDAEHGTSTGWSAAYDSLVIFDGGGGGTTAAIALGGNGVQADYVTVDGAVRYGIWVRNAYYGVNTISGPAQRAHNVTLRYLEIGDDGAYRLSEDGIQGKGNNLVVEYCYIRDNDSAVTHGDNIQWFDGDNVVFRYNVFKNGGQMFKVGEEAFSTYVTNLSVYYNVFFNRGGGHYNGMVLAVGAPPAGDTYNIYNNTFDLEAIDDSGFNSLFYPLSGAGTINFKNNAAIATNASQVTNTVHNNNAYDNSAPYIVYNIPTETGRVVANDLAFVAVSTSDYHLAVGSPLIAAGVDLGASVDFDGNSVPNPPSIGAFEYNAGDPNPGTVTITTNGGVDFDTTMTLVTIEGTASDSDGLASIEFSTSQGESGNCTGTSSWSCSVTISQGVNIVVITATDDSGYTSVDTIDVTYYLPVSDQDVVNINGAEHIYFSLASDTDVQLIGSVNAPDGGSNSFCIDIDNDPGEGDATCNDENNAWHIILLTIGFEDRMVCWGIFDNCATKTWALNSGNHVVMLNPREVGADIESITFDFLSAAIYAPVYVP